ncbi:MAG: hypothetical protein ACRDP7_25745, partial [Trebonia sp.]
MVESNAVYRQHVNGKVLFARPEIMGRAWLPYLFAGIGWVTIGVVVLGAQRGLGLIFVGISCLSLGGY